MNNTRLNSIEKSDNALWKINTFLMLLIAPGCIIVIYFLLGFNQRVERLGVNYLSVFFNSAIGASFLIYAEFILQKYKAIAYYNLVIAAVFIISALAASKLIIILWSFGLLHLMYLMLYSEENKARITYHLFLFLLIPLYCGISSYFLIFTGFDYPLVYDEYLLAIDGTLGFYPSFILGKINLELPEQLVYLFNCMYDALPLFLIILFKKRELREKSPPIELLVEALVIGIVGYALYSILPVCGSTNAFQSSWPNFFPVGLAENGPHLVSCSRLIPRNSMPSLHTAWIVCFIRNSFYCGRIMQLFIGIIVIGNLISIFGIGAHYLIDVIVGFSFATAIGGIFSLKIPLSNPARWQAIVIGSGVTIAWYFIIFYGLNVLQLSKIVAWSFFLGSVLIGICLEYRLINRYRIEMDKIQVSTLSLT
ncbi:phosphatase PAP2 family protein [Legionella waltersii]|uniref:PAP2 superfamily protein n=1 Tax=Legionella waltersii TaxID=66969 RepID=A0A0W1ALF3_9GAMM|nr:phosphatase PAP2 family protein [Legionella waltersii]KTD82189.1 PAP2 superfamily protein [Legionella waltersii]SNV10607.1 PAP2 superfamily [Legionella waltersii]